MSDKVWVLQADHAFVPGRSIKVFATRAAALVEIESMLDIFADDCEMKRRPGRSWESELQRFNKDRDEGEDFWIDLQQHEVQR